LKNTRMPDLKTIISFTPLSLDRDSRTLKIALSLMRMGYNSIVFENLPSSAGFVPQSISVTTLVSPKRPNTKPSKKTTPKSNENNKYGLNERFHFLFFIVLYFIYRPICGLVQVPKASLYYLHEYRLFPMVYLLSRLRGVPFIYDAHDYYPLVFDENTMSPFWRKWFRPLLNWMEKLSIKHSIGMVTVNEGISNLYQKKFSVRPCILRNSHDIRMDREIEEGIRENLALSTNDFLIVAVGHNKEGLAVDNLIEAGGLAGGRVHIAFIGAGYEQHQETVLRDGLTERIHFIPPLSPTSIVPFIRGADASAILYYAMTEDYEFSLPNKFFQSISAGLPLLYPPLSEISQIAEKNKLGIEINPLDTESILHAIATFSNHPKLRDECAFRAQAASELLSWQQEEGGLSDLVKSVL